MVLTCAAGYTGPGPVRARARPRCWPPGTPSACCGRCWRCWRCCWCRSATGTACGRCWSPARVVFAATWWLPPEGQAAFAALATWFLLLAAPRDRAGAAEPPAGGGARRTPTPTSWPGSPAFPALLWVGVFLLVDVGALLLGGYWLL